MYNINIIHPALCIGTVDVFAFAMPLMNKTGRKRLVYPGKQDRKGDYE